MLLTQACVLWTAQVYEFLDPGSGTLYVAEPPPGLKLSALLAQSLSRLLGSPLTLPLHPLFEVEAGEQLPQLQPLLLPEVGSHFRHSSCGNVLSMCITCWPASMSFQPESMPGHC